MLPLYNGLRINKLKWQLKKLIHLHSAIFSSFMLKIFHLHHQTGAADLMLPDTFAGFCVLPY